jgi:hypothetical protein
MLFFVDTKKTTSGKTGPVTYPGMYRKKKDGLCENDPRYRCLLSSPFLKYGFLQGVILLDHQIDYAADAVIDDESGV